MTETNTITEVDYEIPKVSDWYLDALLLGTFVPTPTEPFAHYNYHDAATGDEELTATDPDKAVQEIKTSWRSQAIRRSYPETAKVECRIHRRDCPEIIDEEELPELYVVARGPGRATCGHFHKPEDEDGLRQCSVAMATEGEEGILDVLRAWPLYDWLKYPENCWGPPLAWTWTTRSRCVTHGTRTTSWSPQRVTSSLRRASARTVGARGSSSTTSRSSAQTTTASSTRSNSPPSGLRSGRTTWSCSEVNGRWPATTRTAPSATSARRTWSPRRTPKTKSITSRSGATTSTKRRHDRTSKPVKRGRMAPLSLCPEWMPMDKQSGIPSKRTAPDRAGAVRSALRSIQLNTLLSRKVTPTAYHSPAASRYVSFSPSTTTRNHWPSS